MMDRPLLVDHEAPHHSISGKLVFFTAGREQFKAHPHVSLQTIILGQSQGFPTFSHFHV